MRRLISISLVLLATLAIVRVSIAQDREYGALRVEPVPFSVPDSITIGDGILVVGDTIGHQVRMAQLSDDAIELDSGWNALGDPDVDGPLSLPEGVAIDAADNIYVVDTGNDSVRLFRRSSDGSHALDAGFGPDLPPADDPQPLDSPKDIAVGPDGGAFLLDAGNKRILRLDGPDDTSWQLHHSNAEWLRPEGLGIASDGTVYLADTGNHSIRRILDDGTEQVLGRYGDEGADLRFPHDVAVGPMTGRVYVADTNNHRILVLAPDGALHRSLGSAPLLNRPASLVLTSQERLWVADSTNSWLVVWPGPEAVGTASSTPPFDGYLRDTRDDVGEEPFGTSVSRSSPAMLVRQQPDVNRALAASEGLNSYGDDLPVYGRVNYLYFEIHNKGPEPLTGGAVGAWTASPTGSHGFPSDWSRNEFGRDDAEASGPAADNLVPVAFVSAGGRAVAGPLRWQPPVPDGGGDCSDESLLMARLVNLNDRTVQASGLAQVRESNNVVIRQLPVVPEECVPVRDRYESNDHVESTALVGENWEHDSAVCPRGTEADSCDGIFENGNAPRYADEVWTLTIPDLSLHNTTDRDFLGVDLPDLGDPRWGLDDIRPEEERSRAGSEPGYTPQPMPECGAVTREDFGPPARDNTVPVSVSTELLVTAEATTGENNEITDQSLDTDGERIRFYRAGEHAPELGSGDRLVKRIVCPQTIEEITRLFLSFGERFRDDGSFDPRPLAALGGYQLQLSYIASIERGTPEWVDEVNHGRGVGRLPCLSPAMPASIPGLPGFTTSFDPTISFPSCTGSGAPGISILFPDHPQRPGIPGCLADGPGCREITRFHWPEGAGDFDLIVFAPESLNIRLMHPSGQPIAEARPAGEQTPLSRSLQEAAVMPDGWTRRHLRVDALPSGRYYLDVSGPPTGYGLVFKPPAVQRAGSK